MKTYPVNLPKTDFPMRADLAKRESQFLQFWQEKKIYIKKYFKNQEIENKTFILHDGPPYANGEIHLGHAINKILKDIILKSKMLEGYVTPYVPGWDCHGLPIELNVEKKYGRIGDKITQEEFMQKCREYAASQVDVQRKAFERLGVLADWENPYLTMNPEYEADIIRALGKIIKNGYIGRGFKPVYWCTSCGSALAEAEVEYQDKESPAIDVRFRFVNSEQLFKEKFNFKNIKNASIPIWTTTPWTLPANEAVCLNAEIDYILVESKRQENDIEYLLIAEPLLGTFSERSGYDSHLTNNHKAEPHLSGNLPLNCRCERHIIKTIGKVNVKALEGELLLHPFLTKQIPIILGDHVTIDAGTGAVHTAPAHGIDDYKIGLKYKLPINNPVDALGRFLPNTEFTNEFPEFIGLKVLEANDKVIELLKKHDNLICNKKITHSYPHCWRHKKPLIFRATPQWFVFMDKAGTNGKTLREMALNLIDDEEQVQWLAPHGRDRIRDMVQNRPDWCISRQRVWGTPIALFVHKDTFELHPQWEKLLELVVNEISEKGIEFWQNLDAQEFLKKHIVEANSCGCQSFDISSNIDDYVKVIDTLDVWFDAGVSHFCVLQKYVKENLFKINELKNKTLEFDPSNPLMANLYLEGSDQYRGWFQSSLLTALAIYGKAPFRQVISHGFTVDGEGKKMSKSLGNVISPQKINDTLGADILRLWAASLYMYDDLPASDEILARNVDTYRFIRNMSRFLLGNLDGFNPKTDILNLNDLLKLDRFALFEVFKTRDVIRDLYSKYQFPSVCSTLTTQLNELSNFYFSVIKDRLYTMPVNSHGRRSAQTTLYYILETLVRCIAPVLSFTAEEIWQDMRKIYNDERVESVFLAEISNDKIEYDKNDLLNPSVWSFNAENIQEIVNIVNKEIEKHRATGEIGSSLEAEVIIYCEKNGLYPSLQMLSDELKFVFITSKAQLIPISEAPPNAVETSLPWLKLTVTKSPYVKCPRCWHRRADIGKNPDYPEVCARCAGNLSPDARQWEKREFA